MISDRIHMIDLSINLVEEIYGKQDTVEQLIELLQEEFPDDNYTIDEVYTWYECATEMEDLRKQFENNGLCYETLQSTLDPGCLQDCQQPIT